MMKSLIVTSTCICRPTIHRRCFTALLGYLKNCKAHFVVNIDPVSGTVEKATQLQTKEHLEGLITGAGHTCEFYMPERPCFYRATQRVLQRAEELLDDTKAVLWFEDDKMFRTSPHIDSFLSREDCSDTVHHFWKRSAQCPTFHPCMWGYKPALKYLFPPFRTDAAQDPELALMGYWRKHFENEFAVHYYRQCTVDIGRQWQVENSIKKWVKEDMVNKDVVSY